MILIKKGRQPNRFLQYKRQPNASYQDLPSDIKEILKKSLLDEQKELCAYCMRKITSNDMKIEHYYSQSSEPDKQLEYLNLLAVCKGFEGKSNKQQTCDTKKGNRELTISPLNRGHMLTISYKSSDGTIQSKLYANDLDKILNLNQDELKKGRKSALNAFQYFISKKHKEKSMKKGQVEKLLEKYQAKTGSSYKGIIIAYLEKKLKGAPS
ncbi:retron system putative HNH endonuclease [Streptococcus iners]|uniref:TIGR02646 family protein n=1 Tax=Streptococcus iners TaxID=3028084 RepID=A0AA96VJ81_9STRE|nr:retron system putative HNH endonuclease [Streptococcus sp. 29887]MCK4024639.1 TIGR02646 family protein [Streptococcus suis]WNY50396.1 TIGR02646 family protein [Streptococcus sp. 29887]